MVKRFSKLLNIALIIALLGTTGITAAFATDEAGPLGDSPANAVMPANGPVTIEAGQWHWHIFRSQVPVNVEEIEDDVVTNISDATIDATLRIASGDVGFEIWSADDLNNWINAQEFTPTGAGTVNEFMPGDPLHWQGSFKHNNSFYLIVMNRSATAATYTLDIRGNVKFPSAETLSDSMDSGAIQPDANVSEPLPEVSDAPVLSESTASETIVVSDAGSGPGNTLMPAQGTVTIAPGQWQWYLIRSQTPVDLNADEADVVTNPTDATIDAALWAQSGDVDFEVWSADDLSDWVSAKEFEPMGAGTENEFMPNDPLFWQGSFKHNSNFYLIVKNRSAAPASYLLSVSGNVSFPSNSVLPVN